MALHRQCLQNHRRNSKHRGQRSGHTSNLSFILMVIYVMIMVETANPSFRSNRLFAQVIDKKSSNEMARNLPHKIFSLFDTSYLLQNTFCTTFTSKCQLVSSGLTASFVADVHRFLSYYTYYPYGQPH